MNTAAHLIFGAAAFARSGQPRVTGAAIFGALLPDLSLYLMAGWSLFVMAIPAERVFDELYYSDAWQSVFAVDNSIPFWAFALALGLWRRWPVLVAFAGAGLLHLAFDFALHHDDARAHFWPLSTWVFRSPISYWDRDHFANIVGPVEIAVSLGLCVVLWRRFTSWQGRALVVLAAVAEAAPGIVLVLIFRGVMPHN